MHSKFHFNGRNTIENRCKKILINSQKILRELVTRLYGRFMLHVIPFDYLNMTLVDQIPNYVNVASAYLVKSFSY